MFFEAQRNFNRLGASGYLADTRQNYVRDMMRQYGNRGQPVKLPSNPEESWKQAVHFRQQEERRIQTQLAEYERRAKRAESRAYQFANFINSLEFLKEEEEEDDRAAGRDGDDGDGDRGAGVLPPTHPTNEADAAPGGSIVSEAVRDDERSSTGGGRGAPVRANPEHPDKNGSEQTDRNDDDGRTPRIVELEGVASPNVDRPAAEHTDEERRDRDVPASD